MEKGDCSTTLIAQTTAAELGRQQDMRRNVLVGALLAPQPTAREQCLGRPGNSVPE